MKVNVEMTIEDFENYLKYRKDNLAYRGELVKELLNALENIELPEDMQNFKRNLIDYLKKVTSL